jgi:hypothetical protein
MPAVSRSALLRATYDLYGLIVSYMKVVDHTEGLWYHYAIRTAES